MVQLFTLSAMLTISIKPSIKQAKKMPRIEPTTPFTTHLPPDGSRCKQKSRTRQCAHLLLFSRFIMKVNKWWQIMLMIKKQNAVKQLPSVKISWGGGGNCGTYFSQYIFCRSSGFIKRHLLCFHPIDNILW